MENMAYTKAYGEYVQKQAAVFRADYLRESGTIGLSPCYSLKKRSYSGAVGPYTLHATENELLDAAGTVLYTWKNLDDSAEFCRIIDRSDGRQYLVFRRDLYGYSVLDLSSLRDFHYIPSGSFPEGETFIWTDVFYNRENDLLAVSGCYWACPFGTLLLDFSRPMENPGIWVDVQERIRDGYDRYDDVDFAGWQGTQLVLRAVDSQTGEKETILVPERHTMQWLAGG